MVLRLEMCIIMFLQLWRGGTFVTFKLKFCVQKYMFESKSLSTDPSSCDDLKNWVLTYGAPEGWWAFHSPRV
jgi:hypothetical protein